MELGNLIFGHSHGKVHIPRHVGFEEELIRLFGTYEPESASYSPKFENDTFWVFPYWWGECDCKNEHEPNCPCLKDNFHYKPTNWGVQWYKYPLRDAYWDSEVTLDKFKQIVDKCIESLHKEQENGL